MFIGTRNNSYQEGVITFDSPSSGTYTFEYWNSEGTNPLVKIADGYGDFTTEPIDDDYSTSDLLFDDYFSDDFTINWPIHTHNGMINHLHEYRFSIHSRHNFRSHCHQNHDCERPFHTFDTKLEIQVIYGTPIGSAKVGFEMEDSALILELVLPLSNPQLVDMILEIKDGSEEFKTYPLVFLEHGNFLRNQHKCPTRREIEKCRQNMFSRVWIS